MSCILSLRSLKWLSTFWISLFVFYFLFRHLLPSLSSVPSTLYSQPPISGQAPVPCTPSSLYLTPHPPAPCPIPTPQFPLPQYHNPSVHTPFTPASNPTVQLPKPSTLWTLQLPAIVALHSWPPVLCSLWFPLVVLGPWGGSSEAWEGAGATLQSVWNIEFDFPGPVQGVKGRGWWHWNRSWFLKCLPLGALHHVLRLLICALGSPQFGSWASLCTCIQSGIGDPSSTSCTCVHIYVLVCCVYTVYMYLCACAYWCTGVCMHLCVLMCVWISTPPPGPQKHKYLLCYENRHTRLG